jgi:hypothetical protein
MVKAMRRRLLLGGVLALAVGCNPLGNAALDGSLFVQSEPIEGSDLVLFSASLGAVSDTGECEVLPLTAQITVNGKPADIQNRGSKIKELFSSCETIGFSAQVPANSEAVTFRVFDLGLEHVAEFRNVFTPMSLRLLSPKEGVLHPGQTVELERLPATDTTLDPIGDGRPSHQAVTFESTGGQSGSVNGLSIRGNRFTFTVPSQVQAGEGFIVLEGEYVPAIERCDFGVCRYSRRRTARLPVVFAVP